MTRNNALLLALLLSVAVNLLVAGIVLGRMGLERGHHEPPPAAWAARELSPETRRVVRRRMVEQLEAVRPLRRELRSAQSGVRRAVSAEDFDPQALKDALAELRRVTNRYQELLHNNLAEIAAGLPPEERSALVRAAMLRDRGGEPGMGGGRRRPPPPPRG
ncbi:MAG: periplasmic heavy metal sensor [Pseudomonadota bacterium]